MGSAGTAAAAVPRRGTLLDTLLPTFDFGHRHALTVAAPPARVFAAAESFRVGEDSSWLVQLLFRLRGLGPTPPGTTRRALAQEGFTVLAEAAGEEVVFGIAGRFWTVDERRNLITVPDARAFIAFAEPGTAKAVMSLRVTPRPDGTTCLTTETRVACVDAAAYWRFAPYWLLIKPFSACIRRDMLQAIARRALAGA